MVFTNKKELTGLLGNPWANRLGLHVFRIIASDLMCWLRRLPFAALDYSAYKRFSQEGILVVEDFLEEDDFKLVFHEIYSGLENAPLLEPECAVGFGQKKFHQQGFDRYDGSSLNRFVHIENNSKINRALISKKMNKLTLVLFGLINKKTKYYIYELRHGDHQANHDRQKDTHKDTFHHTYKLWYFIEEVTLEAGALEYAQGSHRSTWARLKWEYQMSCQASQDKSHPNRGGAFRISDAELQKINTQPLRKLLVKANSIVIVDTRGFHRRGDAAMNAKRLSIYANFRPWAFWPFVH